MQQPISGVSYYESRKAESALVLPNLNAFSVGKQVPQQWSPYEDNGGTCAAISGRGFAIVAADTRLNGDFCIHSRNDNSKLHKLTQHAWLASGGMQADRLQLQQILKHRIRWYGYHNNNKKPTIKAIAQLLSTVLYQRRGFPYYTFNIIAGVDECAADDDYGLCYSYDAVGCTEPLTYGTTGTASSFVEPLMDCLLKRGNTVGKIPHDVTKDEALLLLKNALTGAAERDIFTGDCVKFVIITKKGTEVEYMPLRKD